MPFRQMKCYHWHNEPHILYTTSEGTTYHRFWHTASRTWRPERLGATGREFALLESPTERRLICCDTLLKQALLGPPTEWLTATAVPCANPAHIAAVRDAEKQYIHLFLEDADGSVLRGYLDANKTYHSCGSVVAGRSSCLNAIARSNGLVDLFYAGSDGGNWHGYVDPANDYRDYHVDGQTGASSVTYLNAVMRQDGTIYLFYVGGDRGIWHGYLEAGATGLSGHYHGDESTGASNASHLRTLLHPDGTIHLYYIGGDGCLWHGYLEAGALCHVGHYHGDERITPNATSNFCVALGDDYRRTHLFETAAATGLTTYWFEDPSGAWKHQSLPVV